MGINKSNNICISKKSIPDSISSLSDLKYVLYGPIGLSYLKLAS